MTTIARPGDRAYILLRDLYDLLFKIPIPAIVAVEGRSFFDHGVRTPPKAGKPASPGEEIQIHSYREESRNKQKIAKGEDLNRRQQR
jgi:hypothetical protein